jgi:Domain of unknown function (DUF4390)
MGQLLCPALLLLGSLCLGMPAFGATELAQLKLERTDEGLFLSSSLQLDLAPAVETALERAVPIYFVMQVDVFRERWYWSDRRVISTSRTYRLAYQPLTRRWRVSVSSGAGPATGLQYALHQNFETLSQAVTSIARVSRWRVAEPERLEADAVHHLNYQFKLDMALLPRPFQLGMNAQPEWHIDLRRSLPVPLWAPAPASLGVVDAPAAAHGTSTEDDKAIVVPLR